MQGDLAVYGEAIAGIRALIETSDYVSADGRVEVLSDGIEQYVDWVGEHAQFGDRKLRIGVDGGNGVAGPTVLATLERLGIEAVPMFCEPDGDFPNHHPDPTVAENLVTLIARVRSEGLDFGVAFDGDGDRIGVVDERGQIIWGDKLMIVFARDILRQEPGSTIVGEVKCSQTLFDDIAAHGGHPIMWKVGHSLIKAKMRSSGAALAGEMSGHIFFKHRFFGFDDACYSMTRLAEIVSRSDAPLSSLLDDVPETFVTPEIRVDVGDDALKFRVADAIARDYTEGDIDGVREVITIDGVRVIFEDGWGLVRASNTQPVLVLRAEASTAARRDAIEADLRARIQAAVDQ
jgi:phosphomannomutase/phosphoglucomutase